MSALIKSISKETQIDEQKIESLVIDQDVIDQADIDDLDLIISATEGFIDAYTGRLISVAARNYDNGRKAVVKSYEDAIAELNVFMNKALDAQDAWSIANNGKPMNETRNQILGVSAEVTED